MRNTISKFIIPKSGRTTIIFLNTGEDNYLHNSLQKRDGHEASHCIYTYINVYIINCDRKPTMNNRVKVLRAAEQLGDQINSFFEEKGEEVFNMKFEITNNFNFQELVCLGNHDINTEWLIPNCCSIEYISKSNPSIDLPQSDSKIEDEEDNSVKPKKELSNEREIEILEKLTTMLEEIREGVEYEGVRNEDEFFDAVWHNEQETKEEQKFIRDWVILTRPQKKEIKAQIKSKNSDKQVEVENFKIILKEASKRPAWAPKDYHEVLQCLLRLSERPRVVVKFWKGIVERIENPEKVWKSCQDQRLLDILSIKGNEIIEFQNTISEIRKKCEEEVA